MHHLLQRLAAILAVALIAAPAATAADIRLARSPSGRPLPGVTIEGQIAPGDFVKFASLVLATRGANTVWLASGGGNLSEALRIGRLIRQLAMEVHAPVDRDVPVIELARADNNTCASACFLLYAAGVSRHGLVLGIHRPSLPASEYFALGLDGSAAAHQRIEEATAAYLRQMGVPVSYFSTMMNTRSTETVWLSRQQIERDLTGLVGDYATLVGTVCGTGAAPDSAGASDCASRLLAEVQEDRRARTKTQVLGGRSSGPP